MNKLVLSVLFLGVFVVLFASAVFAQNNNNSPNAPRAEPVKNMTYGQCVSAAAELKNNCFETVKQTRVSCVESAGNETVKKKQCNSDYKKELTQCKVDFKAIKKDCIQKTKPSMWARMRYGFA